jgi:hypothetical protein
MLLISITLEYVLTLSRLAYPSFATGPLLLILSDENGYCDKDEHGICRPVPWYASLRHTCRALKASPEFTR